MNHTKKCHTYLTYLDHLMNRKYIRISRRVRTDLLESQGASGITKGAHRSDKTTDLGEAHAPRPTVDLETGTCFYFSRSVPSSLSQRLSPRGSHFQFSGDTFPMIVDQSTVANELPLFSSTRLTG